MIPRDQSLYKKSFQKYETFEIIENINQSSTNKCVLTTCCCGAMFRLQRNSDLAFSLFRRNSLWAVLPSICFWPRGCSLKKRQHVTNGNITHSSSFWLGCRIHISRTKWSCLYSNRIWMRADQMQVMQLWRELRGWNPETWRTHSMRNLDIMTVARNRWKIYERVDGINHVVVVQKLCAWRWQPQNGLTLWYPFG